MPRNPEDLFIYEVKASRRLDLFAYLLAAAFPEFFFFMVYLHGEIGGLIVFLGVATAVVYSLHRKWTADRTLRVTRKGFSYCGRFWIRRSLLWTQVAGFRIAMTMTLKGPNVYHLEVVLTDGGTSVLDPGYTVFTGFKREELLKQLENHRAVYLDLP